MAKKRKPTGRASARRQSKRAQSATVSPYIPILVGLVLVVVALGILLSLDSWRTTSAESAANATALPMSTQEIPYPDVPRISVQEARDRLDRGEIVMVDVRSEASYDTLHIEGAVSMPEAEILDRLGELNPESVLVLYCT